MMKFGSIRFAGAWVSLKSGSTATTRVVSRNCANSASAVASFFRARRATALALSGEPDEAATVALQAVQVVRETNSERTIRLLMDVAGTLTPWSSRPGPRALSQALSTDRR
jgi:hypothetical protein